MQELPRILTRTEKTERSHPPHRREGQRHIINVVVFKPIKRGSAPIVWLCHFLKSLLKNPSFASLGRCASLPEQRLEVAPRARGRVAPIHSAAEKGSSRKLGFRHKEV